MVQFFACELCSVAGRASGLNDVNNDIYTNSVLVLALETALTATKILGIAVSQNRLATWRHTADKLKLQLVVFDGRLLHREYDQYTFSDSVNDTKNPNKHGPKFLSHPSIGQADSCLLGFPLQFNASSRLWGGKKGEVRLNDISYYVSQVRVITSSTNISTGDWWCAPSTSSLW